MNKRSLHHMIGFRLSAADGDMGNIKDFYFDDGAWMVRYIVADTRHWLPGRLVLISPSEMVQADDTNHVLHIKLAKDQVKESPGIRVVETVSRREEAELVRHFGWSKYWIPDSLGMGHVEGVSPEPLKAPPIPTEEEQQGPQLRGVVEVTGYWAHAQDGEFGKVRDFIADIGTWNIRYLVIETNTPDRNVLIAPDWVKDVSWRNRSVQVDLAKQQIETSPPFSGGSLVDREYEQQLFDFYGRRGYWQ